MKIKLQRFGGFVPLMKEAVADVNWTDDEVKKLLSSIGLKEKKDTKNRDATGHFLEIAGEVVPVDLKKIPLKYKTIFEGLEADLKFVKT